MLRIFERVPAPLRFKTTNKGFLGGSRRIRPRQLISFHNGGSEFALYNKIVMDESAT